MNLKPSLIPDWRSAWKYLSVKASVIWSAVIATWVVLPKESQETLLNMLPFSLGGNGPALVVLIGFLSVLFARLKAQPGITPPEPEAPAAVDIAVADQPPKKGPWW